jgi:hypothetical protein
MRQGFARRVGAEFLLVVGVVTCGWSTTGANPGTIPCIFTHVQPLEDGLCGWMPFWYCTGLEQSTALIGPLEFDLISSSPYALCAPGDLAIGVHWPADWVFVSAEVCGPGPTSFERTENGGIVRLPNLEGLAWSQGGYGIAKLVLDVRSPGGSVEVHAPGCYECVRVILTVTEEDPPAAQLETWGSVKSRFR